MRRGGEETRRRGGEEARRRGDEETRRRGGERQPSVLSCVLEVTLKAAVVPGRSEVSRWGTASQLNTPAEPWQPPQEESENISAGRFMTG